ncbi:hypothetical protein EN781_00260 [Mesorhizobium sp. M4A.F.Ca.ET.090.04.2.1]|uniref:hypothetical protein n=1 Tax=Mesorhizobium sp. M4A.F.Ca.ET.090.04.2.1 TaxID=2496663 RepID=UPI000FCB16FC|nr:hypothetical protein [Mesorhizobium sp. M4A.F.Ca.ET.090.04.2.1]RVC47604.1 hypothetical protein EN781_00260 [Mesorhizobium sp. M4A.F.Ca.ET.090.04.2.1]
MTDRPILFSSAMVRALLASTKSQTRRVLKPQPPSWATFCQQPTMLNALHQWVPSGLWAWSEEEKKPPSKLRRWPVDAAGDHYWLNPRYAVGDRLYVREEYSFCHSWAGVPPRDVIPAAPVWCWADGNPSDGDWTKPKPGMHMPRWASRLTLTVTDVRVQQLQAISETDAIAEGCPVSTVPGTIGHPLCQVGFNEMGTPIFWYRKLWNSLNESRGFGWNANPWVIAVSFTVERCNIDAVPA